MSRYRKGAVPPSSGTLDREPIARLLRRLHRERVCGILQVKWRGKLKALEFGEGYPLAVWSNLEAERLDVRLAASGKLRSQDLDEAQRRRHEGGPLLGEILVALGAMGEEELATALQEQADEKILELFSWEGGQYRFRPGETLRRSTRIAVVSSPAALIMRGVLERMPLKQIDDYWDSYGSASLAPAGDPHDCFHDVEIDPSGAAMLDACEGGMPIAEICALAEAERRVAYALVQSGLLALCETSDPPRPTAAAGSSTCTRESEASPREECSGEEARAGLTTLLKQLEQEDPFARLGLSREATGEAIAKARSRLAYQTHPDRYAQEPSTVQGLAQQAFSQVEATYQALSDPERLAQYRRDPLHDRHQSEALEDARMALEAERWFGQGVRSLNQHRWKPAFQHFRRAVEAYPEEGEYHCYYGWTHYLVHGRGEESLKRAFNLIKKGVKLAPKSSAGWLFLGRLYQMVDRFERAEQMLLRSLQCDPRNIEAMRELRILESRRPKGVRSLLKKVRALTPGK